MDGDGWVDCALGHRHWGRYGAAGLLVAAPDGAVLLQHRAAWSHGGSTWAVPGGARTSTETALEAALRETVEETRLDVAQVSLLGEHVADHGTWAYTTVVGTVPVRLPVVLDRESAELRWVPAADVEALPLLPSFAAAWPALRDLLP